MHDPLTQVVALLQPNGWFSKVVEGAGAWTVRRSEAGRPFYCAMLDGTAQLRVQGDAFTLRRGDFVLIPSANDFEMTSAATPSSGVGEAPPEELRPGVFRLGDQTAPADMRMLIGYCRFGSPDAELLVSLLPQFVHIRGEARLTTLVGLVYAESRADRLGREAILARLVEVLLIEALRCSSTAKATPGLLRGLADERLSVALRQIHAQPTWPWTVPELAKQAALSRSSFFDRFRLAVGVAPMEYVLQWRMALAKDLLRRGAGGVAEIAQQVGYSSASTFSVAFARHVGYPPAAFARRFAIA